ncbi:MAG: ABC transporter ATP-binding protein/permease [Zoogloeaceae bacterium]|nr:ABC transporter ATP-binding protein/permease [Zoogloeaceae bacterium]
MDWSHELLDSLEWLGLAFAASLIGLAVTVWLLARGTVWGRQVRRLAWSYFQPGRSWRPLLWLGVIVFLTLFSVRMNVLFSYWYNGFYSAMQELDGQAFWFMLAVFGVLATVHVARELLTFYLRQAFLIRWRTWLTQELMSRWLERQAYYRTHHLPRPIDNPDQRIQQDVDSFVTSTLGLSMGLLDAVVSLFAFTLILWNLSGALAVFGVEVPRAMVFLVYAYVIVATVFAVKIGRPLVRLSFLNERFNASFRYALIRLREYGESIAFFGGEAVERRTLLRRFGQVITNMWAIVFRSLKLQGFNLTVSQGAVVFPFIVQAPRLLSKEITLGDVMQTAQSFDQVQGALSFFRTSYDEFASYRAVLDRLTGFLDAVEAATQLPSARIEPAAGRLELEGVTVRSPSGEVLAQEVEFSLGVGQALLIRGPSGAGKTTLLRAIAGLWPHVEGTVRRPLADAALFLPQKPYLPLGSLRTAVHYPADSAAPGQAEEALRRCHLGHLVGRLDDEADWTRILSLGEQQRLAIARVLLARPQIIFLDEASSALDEGLEHAMYTLLRTALPEAVLVSVGHRSSLVGFHGQTLDLTGGGAWRLVAGPSS